MFGLESRALKKQFGKLFLVRMQSVGSQETRGARIQSNRAAMFGLDARIALAIFGALSVISGAALYSAIQQAKVVSFVTEMTEFAKAREQYLLDVGADMPLSSSTRNLLTANLVSSSAAGWNGPYFPYAIHSSTPEYLSHPTYDKAMFVLAPKTPAWNIPTDSTPLCSANPSEACHVWVHITAVDKTLNEQIDEYIDGTVDGQDGNYRWRSDATYYNVGLAFN